MHSADAQALLAGVCADVDADLPRLVFADFLEETGHPANVARAAFIRLQLEYDADARDAPTLVDDRNRMLELKAMFQDEWERAWSVEPCPVKYGHRRGFVDEIVGNLDQALVVGPILWEDTPVTRFSIVPLMQPIRAPEGGPCFETCEEFFRQPFLARLRHLRFAQVGPGDLGEDLLRSPTMTGLRTLGFVHAECDDLGLLRLLTVIRNSEFFETLEELDFSDNRLTDQAAHALAAADWPPNFRLLKLDGNRLTAAGYAIVSGRFTRDGQRRARVI